jgi:hypothetical protein
VSIIGDTCRLLLAADPFAPRFSIRLALGGGDRFFVAFLVLFPAGVRIDRLGDLRQLLIRRGFLVQALAIFGSAFTSCDSAL